MATPISEKMKALELSDAALAVLVGCERSMITKLKLGKATASLPLAIRLSETLGLPPATFIASQAAPAPASAVA